jgi:hypothetical protein
MWVYVHKSVCVHEFVYICACVYELVCVHMHEFVCACVLQAYSFASKGCHTVAGAGAFLRLLIAPCAYKLCHFPQGGLPPC